MTPQEIAGRLGELTGAPHDDDTITALARIPAEAIRALNHATTAPATGLTDPATVNQVAGQLATAADRLQQLLAQLARWLTEQTTAGHLAHDSGDPALTASLFDVVGSLDIDASTAARKLAQALNRANSATAGLYRTDQGDEQ